MTTQDVNLNDALSQVRRVMESVVRAEQLRDRLTGLPNDSALTEILEGYLQADKRFWFAFVEVDHFKRINDAFGYSSANGMLMKIAEHLRLSRDYFPSGATAFRAHGDEFFLVGELAEDEVVRIEESLDRIRGQIRGLALKVHGKAKPMSCTVSVGWTVSTDARGPERTPEGLRELLEHAINHAKRHGRDCVVRFDDEKRKSRTHSVRDNCPTCKSAFTLDTPVDELRGDKLFCPNCGERIGRPAPPEAPPAVVPI